MSTQPGRRLTHPTRRPDELRERGLPTDGNAPEFEAILPAIQPVNRRDRPFISSLGKDGERTTVKIAKWIR